MLIEFSDDYQSFRIVEGGPPITLLRSNPAFSEADAPLFLRGSMNAWSTDTPLIKQPGDRYTVRLKLAPGEYRFKFGSQDWKQANFGTSMGEIVRPNAPAIELVQHGGNIRLSIAEEGTYNFILSNIGDRRYNIVVTTD